MEFAHVMSHIRRRNGSMHDDTKLIRYRIAKAHHYHPAGNGFCYPEYIAANIQQPVDVCEDGFNVNMTGLGQTVCVKKVHREVPSCFRSTSCPTDTDNVHSEKVW